MVTDFVLKKFNLNFGLILHRDNLKGWPDPMGLEIVGEFFKTGKDDIIFIDHLRSNDEASIKGFEHTCLIMANEIKNLNEKPIFVFQDYASLKSLLEKSFKNVNKNHLLLKLELLLKI